MTYAPRIHINADIYYGDGHLFACRHYGQNLLDTAGQPLLKIAQSDLEEVMLVSEVAPEVAVGMLRRLEAVRQERTMMIERAFSALRLDVIAQIEGDEPWDETTRAVRRRSRAYDAFRSAE